MDTISIERLIQGLGKVDFDRIADIVLKDIYHLRVVNVDAKGDRGSDRKILKDAGGSTTVAYQVTVQEDNWQEKALRDARNAVRELKATRYFFLTSRPHEPAAMRHLENSIASELHIPVTCLGGRDLAGMIETNTLLSAILDALGIPHALDSRSRPDNQEILLHSYVALGSDTLKFREGIYDDTLLVTAHQQDKPTSRTDLVAAAVQALGDEGCRDKIERRVDSLLTKGKLIPLRDGYVALASDARDELDQARRVYELEFGKLAAAQAELLRDRYKVNWDSAAALRASSLLSRAFIKKQLDSARDAAMTLNSSAFVRNIGDPLQDLRDLLVEYGIHPSAVGGTLKDLVDLAKDRPLIQKLVSAALFVALEGANPLSTVKALGADQWDQITCVVDASVAIPYLCSRIYSPTHARFAQIYTSVLNELSNLRAYVCIPSVYIAECAAHLVRATDYRHLRVTGDELAYSANGYVSHYYQLRRAGRKAPKTLMEYLAHFSPVIKRPVNDRLDWAKRMMPDIQDRLRFYGVNLLHFDKVTPALRKDIETEYDYVLEQERRRKTSLLVDNDVTTLANIRRMVLQQGKHVIHITWDMITLKTGRRVEGCGWIISPEEAADFIQTLLPMSDAQFAALAHQLAGSHATPEDISALIIDRIVLFARERLEDWEFQDHMSQFRSDVLSRIDVHTPNYVEWVNQQTDTFLRERGINVAEKARTITAETPATKES